MKLVYGAFCAPLVIGVVQWADTTAQFIVLLAATLVGMGVVWTKGVKPVVSFCQGAAEAIDHVRSIPEFQEEVRHRLQVIEGAMYGSDHLDHLPVVPPFTGRKDNPSHDPDS